jgi:hypothetical protein
MRPDDEEYWDLVVFFILIVGLAMLFVYTGKFMDDLRRPPSMEASR